MSELIVKLIPWAIPVLLLISWMMNHPTDVVSRGGKSKSEGGGKAESKSLSPDAPSSTETSDDMKSV